MTWYFVERVTASYFAMLRRNVFKGHGRFNGVAAGETLMGISNPAMASRRSDAIFMGLALPGYGTPMGILNDDATSKILNDDTTSNPNPTWRCKGGAHQSLCNCHDCHGNVMGLRPIAMALPSPPMVVARESFVGFDKMQWTFMATPSAAILTLPAHCRKSS